MDPERGYKLARQLGALTGAAQMALEYLDANNDYWTRAAIIQALKRALAHDGSEDYYNTTSAQKGEAA